ncbi:hypothetical protein FS749_013148 [Ceratobasidium sp. UAMH 11750]|nr:hypothetical protein FS749_013148 [Ceratobasidium sp. UAMH 11750]
MSDNTLDCAYPWIALPTRPFRGLVHLELQSLRAHVYISVGALATTLSDCSALRTLLLRNLWVPSEPHQKYTPIHLPSLQLFQIHGVYGDGAELFLSMLHPGRLELDVRLEMNPNDSDELISRIKSLLARSHVASLAVDLVSDPSMEFTSYISAVPRLRVLILNVPGQKSPKILGGLLCASAAQLPELRALCLIGCDTYAEDMDQVKLIVLSNNLHTVGFLSCRFLSAPSERQHDEDCEDYYYEEYEDNSRDHLPTSYVPELPKTMREWLSERVGRVIVGDVPTTGIHDGIDLFFQKLTPLN